MVTSESENALVFLLEFRFARLWLQLDMGMNNGRNRNRWDGVRSAC